MTPCVLLIITYGPSYKSIGLLIRVVTNGTYYVNILLGKLQETKIQSLGDVEFWSCEHSLPKNVPGSLEVHDNLTKVTCHYIDASEVFQMDIY